MCLLGYVSMFHAARGWGHSHRRCVQLERSRHFLEISQTVQWCSGPYLQHCEAAKRCGRDFVHAQLVDCQWEFLDKAILDGQKS